MQKKRSKGGEKQGPTKKNWPQFSDAVIMLNINLQEHLNCDIEHYTVKFQSVNGIFCKRLKRDTWVKVASSFLGARVATLASILII